MLVDARAYQFATETRCKQQTTVFSPLVHTVLVQTNVYLASWNAIPFRIFRELLTGNGSLPRSNHLAALPVYRNFNEPRKIHSTSGIRISWFQVAALLKCQ